MRSKIRTIYDNLSIIKKVMLAPIIAMVFGIAYLTFTYMQTNSIYNDSKVLENVLIPLLEKSSQNRSNFNQITEIFTFAVSSGELEYLKHTEEHIESVKNNLLWMERAFPIDNSNIKESNSLFYEYIAIANEMAKKMQSDNVDIMNDETFIKKVFLTSKAVKNNFDNLHLDIKKLISDENKKINDKISILLEYGIYAAIIFYLFLFLISWIGYHSIKDGFRKLMQSITSPDANKDNLHKEVLNFADDEFGILSKKFYTTFESIKELEKEKQIVEEIAKRDQLTNLYNRYYFEEILQIVHSKFLSNKIVYGILLFDIDHFKKVNDTYGHIVGDEVLKNIANLFQKIIREQDVIARWGGEEFIILITNVERKQLFEIAEKFRKSIANIDIANVPKVTASFGGCCAFEGLSSKEITKIADAALYKAKNSGRNKVIIRSSL